MPSCNNTLVLFAGRNNPQAEVDRGHVFIKALESTLSNAFIVVRNTNWEIQGVVPFRSDLKACAHGRRHDFFLSLFESVVGI